mgnify:CR=1 FL=1
MPTPERQGSATVDATPEQNDRLIVVRFIHEVPRFMGVDGVEYGPFKPEDLACIPEIHARGLLKKGAIVIVNVPVGGRA